MSFHSKGAFRPVASRWPLVSHPAQGPKRILLSFGDSQGFRIRSSKAALTSIQHMRGGRRVARSAVAMALLVIAVDHLPWERGGEGEEESNERTLKSRNVYAWPKEVNDVILSLSRARALFRSDTFVVTSVSFIRLRPLSMSLGFLCAVLRYVVVVNMTFYLFSLFAMGINQIDKGYD